MNAKEAGQAFLADVLAKITDPDLQAAARSAFEKSEEALTFLGSGTLRQSDYSRQMDTIRQQAEATTAWKAQLDTWYADNAARLEAQPTPSPTPTPTTVPTPTPAPAQNYLTREQLDAERKTWEMQYAGALAFTNRIGLQHYKEFGEVLDLAPLMRDPEVNTIGVEGVYTKTFKARYDEKAAAAYTAKVEADVQRRLTEERAAQTRHPYPVNGREAVPGLDAIESSFLTKAVPDPAQPDAPQLSVVDQAVQQYNARLAQRTANGGF